MISDPYKVLGIVNTATPEEIKKAYRKKVKECHPDLHPDDPDANRKMNEINEAYDMLTNPEKYKTRNNGTQYGKAYSQNGGSASGYTGFTGFGFEDIFGFYSTDSYSAFMPKAEPGDSDEIRHAVYAINGRNYQEAISVLSGVASERRNARWCYLNALANNGIGNKITAVECIKTAVGLEPQNLIYLTVMKQLQRPEQAYTTNSNGFTAGMNVKNLCFGICLARLCCGPCCRC